MWTKETLIKDTRRRRNELLDSSDWTQMLDSPLDSTKKAEWAVYRQALRDVTKQFDSDVNYPELPADVVFPEPPSGG